MIKVFNNSNSSTNQYYFLDLLEKPADVLKKIREIAYPYFFRIDPPLRKNLDSIQPKNLTKALQYFFAETIQKNSAEDIFKILDQLATYIPLNTMQEAVKDQVGDMLNEAKGMFEEAKLYLDSTQNFSISRTLPIQLSNILNALINTLESLIVSFGIADVFKPAENETHATYKSQKIMMLFSTFSLISSLFLPFANSRISSLVIGGTFFLISALSLVWAFIKPMPTYLLANAENITDEIQKESLIVRGRKESLDEIATILKMNRHAILVGPSHVGKTLTAKAFIQAIERGDYPDFAGKRAFRINTADMLKQKALLYKGGGNYILNRISEAMGRHRDDIILILDEIHMACKNNEKICDQLKTFLDEGGEFPHVIGITTDEDYEKYVKDNTAFSLRFDRVDIMNTDRDETLEILSDYLLRSKSRPLIEENALEYIYDKTSQTVGNLQPAASLKLLKRCINLTGKAQKLPTERKITEVANKIHSLRSEAVATRQRKNEAKIAIEALEKQLQELQEIFSKEKEEMASLNRAKNQLDQATKETYQTVIRISGLSQKTLNAKGEHQLKRFLLLYKFLEPSLESYIKSKSQELRIRAVIDKPLIDEVMAS